MYLIYHIQSYDHVLLGTGNQTIISAVLGYAARAIKTPIGPREHIAKHMHPILMSPRGTSTRHLLHTYMLR